MIGTSNQTQLSIIKEVTPGTTPNNPVMQVLRFTGETLQANNATTVSAEIRSDRSTSDLILTDQSNSGEINGEMSGGTYDMLLEAALYSDNGWTSTDYDADTISATATGFADSASRFILEGLQVGQYFKASGFANPLLNRIYRVTDLVAGEIETHPVPAALEASGADVNIQGSTITNGVTDRSFTIQKKFKDLNPVAYSNFRGLRVGGFTMGLSVGSIATIGFSFIGLTSENTEIQIPDLTEVGATTTDLMNCVSDVTRISARGASNQELFFTDLSLNYSNALRELKAIGNLGSIDIRPGTIVANATLNPYFENIDILEVFTENNFFELSFNIKGSDGWEYIFSYPRAKFTSQSLAAGSKDQDMIVNGEVQAILDPDSLKTIRIDRLLPSV